MNVERRPADFRAIEDLSDGNAIVGFLADERAERLVQGGARPLNSPIRSFAARVAPRPGEAVLDVACGTGTLAIRAKEAVGSSGTVYAGSEPKRKGFAGHFRHRHGHLDVAEIVRLLEGAGFQSVESGAVGVRNLYFALGRAPGQPSKQSPHRLLDSG